MLARKIKELIILSFHHQFNTINLAIIFSFFTVAGLSATPISSFNKTNKQKNHHYLMKTSNSLLCHSCHYCSRKKKLIGNDSQYLVRVVFMGMYYHKASEL